MFSAAVIYTGLGTSLFSSCLRAEIMEVAVFCAVQGHRKTVRVEVFQVGRQKR